MACGGVVLGRCDATYRHLTAIYRFSSPGLSDSDSLGGMGRHRASNGAAALAVRVATPWKGYASEPYVQTLRHPWQGEWA